MIRCFIFYIHLLLPWNTREMTYEVSRLSTRIKWDDLYTLRAYYSDLFGIFLWTTISKRTKYSLFCNNCVPEKLSIVKNCWSSSNGLPAENLIWWEVFIADFWTSSQESGLLESRSQLPTSLGSIVPSPDPPTIQPPPLLANQNQPNHHRVSSDQDQAEHVSVSNHWIDEVKVFRRPVTICIVRTISTVRHNFNCQESKHGLLSGEYCCCSSSVSKYHISICIQASLKQCSQIIFK